MLDKRKTVFCCFGRPATLITGVYGGFLLKGNLQLLSSRVVQHYYKIVLIGGAYLAESEDLMASILLPNACSFNFGGIDDARKGRGEA